MRKLLFISAVLLSINTLYAQWTNNPAQNTMFATGNTNYEEIKISSHVQSGSTYVQWIGPYANGWSVSVQKVDSLGNPLWGTEGVHISGQEFNTYSEGVSMAALADGGVVSCFANIAGQCIVVKIDDEGNFAWGEQGIVALATNSCSRTQIVAGHNGGFWVMAQDVESLHFRYYHSDGTPGSNQITISDENGIRIAFGQMVLDDNDHVFAVYMKQQYDVASYFNKSICVAKYGTDGTQLSQEEQLMATVSISGQICHSACSDGMGGGYVWISHPALNDFFEVYLFHFDSNGHSTISDPTGVIVSQPDGVHYHFVPDATLHPTSHDLLMVFNEVDAYSQSYNAIRVNRITANGTKVWGENGLEVVPAAQEDMSSFLIDAYPDGTGASIAYIHNDNSLMTIGIDANGTATWHTTAATSMNTETVILCEYASGFHNGQNIFAFQGERNNIFSLYGQNIHQDGTLGSNSGTSVEEADRTELSIYQSGNTLCVEGADVQQIELLNLAGQLVKVSNKNSHYLAIGNLPQGVYIARVFTRDGMTINRKVIVR